jgi:hypothetical protein
VCTGGFLRPINEPWKSFTWACENFCVFFSLRCLVIDLLPIAPVMYMDMVRTRSEGLSAQGSLLNL